MSPVRTCFVILWSALFTALIPVIRLLALFSKRLHKQMIGRPQLSDLAPTIAAQRSKFDSCYLFFCSSAGEYEQALPLIQRLKKAGHFTYVLFFSRSGFDFARARGDDISGSLCPTVDTLWHWGWLFSALRPTATFVIRHELWPSFLETAAKFGKVYLVDASRSLGEADSLFKRFVRRILLDRFDRIYVVSEDDRNFILQKYSLAQSVVAVAGDTKYDRVVERAIEKAATAQRLAGELSQLAGDRKIIVLGSVHPADIELFAKAFGHIKDIEKLFFVIAPHHIDLELNRSMTTRLRQKRIAVQLYSDRTSEKLNVVIFDRMGVLAELYALTDIAYVGGAIHYQVHNVLEPAGHNASLAFGPKFQNSVEARMMVDSSKATVVSNPVELANFINDATRSDRPVAETRAWLDGQCGATDLIFKELGLQAYA